MTQYNRLAVCTIDEVIHGVIEFWNLQKNASRWTLGNDFSVGVTSLRMRTFGRAHQLGNLYCACCGCKPSFFAVETFARSKDQSIPHVNLYGVRDDGSEVLFTHDHILARSLGGKDDLSNSQVMCSPCNSRKGKEENKILQEMKNAKKAKKNVDDQVHVQC